MNRLATNLLLLMFLLPGICVQSWAQDKTTGTNDDSSQRTEESEEAYRRRMELEGARDSATYSDTSYSSQVEQEKIDKLPPESQKNIRDQITDIIIENGRWEPSDVLEDYPYQPTEAAEKDPALMEQEKEAWAEQVDKYHEREAAAFGAMRPPMPGDPGQPGQPGDPGSEGTEQQAGGQPGSGPQDQQEQSEANSAGGFDPSRSGERSPNDEVSTAGVSESALDFLRGRRGQSAPSGEGNQPQGSPTGTDTGGQEPTAEQNPALAGGDENQQEPEAAQPAAAAEPSDRAADGSIPIEQLDHLKGVAGAPAAQDAAPAETPPQPSANPEPVSQAAEEQLAQADEQNSDPSAESRQESDAAQQQASPDINLDTAGIIAIRDLDKLEGVDEPEEEENP
jgi:hypothetical protein